MPFTGLSLPNSFIVIESLAVLLRPPLDVFVLRHFVCGKNVETRVSKAVKSSLSQMSTRKKSPYHHVMLDKSRLIPVTILLEEDPGAQLTLTTRFKAEKEIVKFPYDLRNVSNLREGGAMHL